MFFSICIYLYFDIIRIEIIQFRVKKKKIQYMFLFQKKILQHQYFK
jgi:hypothetical protein